MNNQTSEKIIDGVRQAYDQIAPEFSQTRADVWPELNQLIAQIKAGAHVLDVGCGNGRLRLLFKDVKINYIGCDISAGQLKQAQQHDRFQLPDQQFVLGNITALPFAENSFEAVFAVAMLHHLPSRAQRLKALTELYRVLKPGGRVYLTNWNFWHLRRLHYIIKSALLKMIGRYHYDLKDVLVPWHNITSRYYHAFTLSELKRLLVSVKFKVQANYLTDHQPKRRSYLRAENLVTIAQK